MNGVVIVPIAGRRLPARYGQSKRSTYHKADISCIQAAEDSPGSFDLLSLPIRLLTTRMQTSTLLFVALGSAWN